MKIVVWAQTRFSRHKISKKKLLIQPDYFSYSGPKIYIFWSWICLFALTFRLTLTTKKQRRTEMEGFVWRLNPRNLFRRSFYKYFLWSCLVEHYFSESAMLTYHSLHYLSKLLTVFVIARSHTFSCCVRRMYFVVMAVEYSHRMKTSVNEQFIAIECHFSL